MAANPLPERVRLSIAVDRELQTRIKQAAAANDLSIRDYVTTILQRAVDTDLADDAPGPQRAWSQLSAGAFARDWASDEDAVYDQLPSR